jgi:NAD(P)-dependent dehydrogenase (short-subunit alcohol dehydrogenase family)
VVTGAASGIGKAITARLVEEGASVVAADYNELGLKELAAGLGEACTTMPYEASSSADARAVVDRAVSEYGRLDVVFANAGIFDGFKTLLDTDEELWDRVISVNLKGYFLLAKAAMPHLLDAPVYLIGARLPAAQRAMVFTASTAGFTSSQGGLAYTASKHGIVGLIRELAYEYAPRGVRVNGVAPGGTHTALGMVEGEASVFTPQILDLVRQTTPLRQYGRPEFAAEAAVFLGSERAGHITGEVLRVDGGYQVRGFPYPDEYPA